jgi:hypothetical protein
MKVVFEKEHATVTNSAGETVMVAHKDESELYLTGFAGVMFPKSSTSSEKARFYVAMMGSPTTSTIQNAVRKGWLKLPGLTTQMLKDHPHSEATAKGHLDRTRMGLDSSKSERKEGRRTSEKTIEISTTQCKNTLYADLAGRFPLMSSNGIEYVLVMKCSDTGYIHVEALKSRTAREVTNAFERGEKFFRDFGNPHQRVKLDNETSGIMRESFKQLNMEVQFVAPNNHRQNAAERDIRTFKNHFIATLATADPGFPMSEWDLLLPQAEMTLNLMRPSRMRPNVSAWEDLRGEYDFKSHPFAPLGTKVTVYEDPDSRGSWSPHGVRGFYVAPALDHYRCFKILVEETRRVRITDSVTWHPREEVTMENVNRLVHDMVETVARESVRKRRKRKKKSRTRATPERKEADSTTTQTSPPPPLPQSPSPQQGEATGSCPPSTSTSESASMGSTAKVTSRGRVSKPNSRYRDQCVNGMLKYGGMAKSYRTACKGEEAQRWHKAACEEFERLIDTTETMKFIPWEKKPTKRIVSYYNPQIRVKVKEDGSREYRVRGTYGGNISDYSGPKAARTADMVSIKVLLNAVASEGAKFMTADIKDFYLGTPMDRKEYMRVHIDQIPPEARQKYVTEGLVKDGYVLAEITKGIYGLAQAGRLAQQRLVNHLAKHGYRPISKINPCMFKHEAKDVIFCLVVDDFGVKYQESEDANHLMNALKELYIVKEDWDGSAYVGFDIAQDRDKGTVNLSMPRYIDDAVQRFKIDTSMEIDCPSRTSRHGKGDHDMANEQQKKRIQQIIGVLLYYARAVDPTILVRVSKISSEMANATVGTLKDAERVIQYAATNPRARLVFHRSDMKLTCYSDASYLTEKDGRSRRGGLFFLGNNSETDMLNGPILCCSGIIDVVVSSAAESEYAAGYMNAKEATHIRTTLEALGYSQGATPIISDNSFVCDLVNGECKAKKSRAMDMRFFWLRDRVEQGQFNVTWHSREQNLADYFTKDLPAKDFVRLRSFVVPENGRRSVKELVGTSSRTPEESAENGMVCEEGVFKTENVVTPGDTGRHKPPTTQPISQSRSKRNKLKL